MKNYWAIILIFLAAACNQKAEETSAGASKKKQLPYLGQYDVVLKEENGRKVKDTVYQTIPTFNLLNQQGERFSSNILDGKIYVADFFFTHCPTICPTMTKNMIKVQEAIKDVPGFQIVSFSIDPERDTAEVLQNYIKKYEIADTNWHFLTGDKQKIYDLGYKYKLNVMESDDPADGGFIHSEHFMLIDQEGYIRGAYVGTNPKEVEQLIRDIRKLNTNGRAGN